MPSDDLRERLQDFLTSRTGKPVDVSDLVRLPGGASRETWTFTASGRRLVLRRDPPGAPASTDRAQEAELLHRAQRAGVPVPEVIWTADDPDVLGAKGFLMDFVDGETIARRILREEVYGRARQRMAAQCGDILARIHAVPADELGFEAPPGHPGLEVLERYRSLFDAYGESHPAFELAMRWLEPRAPEDFRVTLVHGDFRNGNLIVGPDGIRAVIDWELAHLGDPREDLAWLCTRSWRFGGPGEVGGFGSRRDLYAAYERASGVAVDPDAVRWWEVLSNLKWGVMCLTQAFTHLWGHVRSVELAAIGRRAVETEYDLLRLLGAS